MGFVGSYTAASLTTQPTLSTTATSTSLVSGSPYTITVSGAVDADYTISYVSGSLTVTQATPTVTVTDAGGLYTGSTYPATDTVAGVVSGVDSTPAASLESVTPSLTYYSGATTTGTPLSGAPSSVGTYTVLASFAGSSDYTSGSASTIFIISSSAATPTVIVSDAGGTYKGAGFAATATVNGSSSLQGVAPTFTYYNGTTAGGSASSSAPIHVGTYTVVASFAGSANYTSAQSSPATFSITTAPLTVTANNQTKVYGAALPTFSASYSGFQGSDTSASLTTQPMLSTTATITSTVSGNPYPITVSGAVDPDYTISYVAGSLTVTAATTSVSSTVSTATTTYGQSVTLTATVSASPTPNEGKVTFAIGGTTVGTASVVSGVAQLATATLPTGTDEITVTYSDSRGNYASTIPAVGATSTIFTAAGVGNYSGDGGPATQATLNNPKGIVVDAAGDVFIADALNNVIREVNHATGVITTVVGNGTAGYNGDNIAATAAEINSPQGLALDSAGDLFIADQNNQRIREVNATTGIITTVAGTGVAGFNSDNIRATAAKLYNPSAIAIDSAGDLIIADDSNGRIREVNKGTGVITTIAGNGLGG